MFGHRRASEVRLGSERDRGRRPVAPVRDGEAARPQKPRIMIVEDEIFVAMHLESVLEEMGFEVSALASSGEGALAEFERHRPELVLMDINLGTGIDGVTTAERLRRAGDVRIIFVTAYSDPATRARIEAALPGSPVLSKPVATAALKAAIAAEGRRH